MLRFLAMPVHHPLVSMVVAYAIWGASSPITKLALRELTPSVLLFLRMMVACIIMLPLVWRYRRHLSHTEQIFIFLSGFIGVFLNVFLFYGGLPAVPSINAPIIGAIGPLILALFARVLLHEKLQRHTYIGMAAGFVGTLCITILPLLFSSNSDVLGIESIFGVSPLMGNIALVMSTIAGVLGTIFLRPTRHIPGYVVAFWQFAIAASFSFPFAVSENIGHQLMSVGWDGVIGILYAGILSSVVAYTLYNESLHKVATSESGILSYVAPIAAVGVAIPLLGEYPSVWFILGAALIITGVWMTEKKSVKP